MSHLSTIFIDHISKGTLLVPTTGQIIIPGMLCADDLAISFLTIYGLEKADYVIKYC
jgi:hypothetical protein